MATQAFCRDCMEAMREFPDKFFDLAVVDPPYGINASEMTMGRGVKNWVKGTHWDDSPPDAEYFRELFRVSEHCIIWGGNYYQLPKTNAWIVWDKMIYGGLSFSDCEFAWTDLDINARIIQVAYSGARGADQGGKIHPTQKPIKLYRELFARYAKDGMKILDTHLGSGSSRIAAYDAGLDFWGYEISRTYFDLQEERFARHAAQLSLFVD